MVAAGSVVGAMAAAVATMAEWRITRGLIRGKKTVYAKLAMGASQMMR